VKVRFHPEAFVEILNSPGVGEDLKARGERMLAQARATAPVVTGTYRDSLELVVEHTDRVRIKVQSTVPYGLKVEAEHGTLARAVDAGGGA
jgi:hypothetical protein